MRFTQNLCVVLGAWVASCSSDSEPMPVSVAVNPHDVTFASDTVDSSSVDTSISSADVADTLEDASTSDASQNDDVQTEVDTTLPDAGRRSLGGWIAGTRLEPITITGDDGSSQPVILGWFDTQRNERCTYAKASDGTMRCMPWLGITAPMDWFLDDKCTVALTYALKDKEVVGCPPKAKPKYATKSEQGKCSSDAYTRIYEIGAEVSPQPTKLYKFVNECGVGSDANTDLYRYFHVGAEVSPSAFVAGTYSHPLD